MAPTDIRGSAQGLYTAVTQGLGLFLGNAVHRRRDGLFPPRRQVPLAAYFPRSLLLLALCVLAFAVLFKG